MSKGRSTTPPNYGGGAKPAAGSVADCPDDCGKDAISNVTKCCGSEIVKDATKANGGKAPNVVFGTPPEGFDGVTNTETGTITVRDTKSLCTDTETVFFELNNMSAKPAFDKVADDVNAGNLSREDYTKAMAKIEYDNVRKTLATIDKCKEKWGCKDFTFSFDNMRPAKDFDDYYQNYTTEKYKNYYRDFWDKNYKAGFDKKHPPPK